MIRSFQNRNTVVLPAGSSQIQYHRSRAKESMNENNDIRQRRTDVGLCQGIHETPCPLAGTGSILPAM